MSDTEKAVDMLNDVLERKMNSPAAYVLEATPYVTEADRPIVAEIEALEQTDRRHAAETAQRILALEGAPRGGSHDPSVADSNYLSVRYLLGQLLARLEANLALFAQYRDRCGILEARDLFAQIVEDDISHRNRLKALRDVLDAQPTATHLPGEHRKGSNER
jgi:bacterioferritin (cytochrome b1)